MTFRPTALQRANAAKNASRAAAVKREAAQQGFDFDRAIEGLHRIFRELDGRNVT